MSYIVYTKQLIMKHKTLYVRDIFSDKPLTIHEDKATVYKNYYDALLICGQMRLILPLHEWRIKSK